ncbi:mariner Mos1 transposase [Trichonephila clavipes]|nr:mariner Mos1 transposase [Trichonephila clavipes]
MVVTERPVTSRTIAQNIETVRRNSVYARTFRRHLQQSGLSARRPFLSTLDAEPQTSPPPMIEWAPQGHRINQKYFIEVLRKLRVRMRMKMPEQQSNNTGILHQDNAPMHTAFSVKQFLVDKHITVLEDLPYSPDLVPYNFYLFLKVKNVLMGTQFLSTEEVKSKLADLLKMLTSNGPQRCFERWKTRMDLCIGREGEYFEEN